MDKRTDWNKSSTALRSILREITGGTYQTRVVKYKFGAVFKRRLNMWYIYNIVTDNIICTVKHGESPVIRYRAKSHYANMITTCDRLASMKPIYLASQSLGLNKSWVRGHVQPFIQREYDSDMQTATEERIGLSNVVWSSESLTEVVVDSPTTQQTAFNTEELIRRLVEQHSGGGR